jgi:hypothetical protein
MCLQMGWRWTGSGAIEVSDEAGQRGIALLLQKDIRVALAQSLVARVSM